MITKISEAYLIEKLIQHGIYCLPCSYTNDVKYIITIHAHIATMTPYCFQSDDLGMPLSQGTEHNSWLSLVAVVTDLCLISFIIRGAHSIQCMPCSSGIIGEMLPEIHSTENCNFLEFIIHSQIFNSLL